jgi:gliding motility-associated-like protein
MKTIPFLFLFLVYGVYAGAQCDFNMEAVVIQHSDCAANGIIQVNLSGNKIDLTKIQIILTDGAQVNLVSNENNKQFTTLSGGVYTVTANIGCINSSTSVTKSTTVTINSNSSAVYASINDSRKPLTCNEVNTGMISIYIYNGKAPYTVEVSAPAGYSGQTEFTQIASGTFTLDNLPAGNYSFSITDACSYNILRSFDLQPVSNFPTNFFSDHALIELPPNNCDEVKFSISGMPAEWAYYVNNGYYEVSFSVNGNDLGWMPIQSEYKITLPYKIKEMRDNKYTIKVKIRLKGYCSALVEEIDEIYIPDSSIYDYWAGIDCKNVKYFFKVNNICYSYKWEIYEKGTNVLVKSGAVSEEIITEVIIDLNKDYTIIFADNDDFQISKDIRMTQEDLYFLENDTHFCLPDTFTMLSQIGIRGTKIPAGTRIKQISGPTVINSDVTTDEELEQYYPFSKDYKKAEYARIEDGTYSFEITNICGDPPFVKDFTYANHTYRGFSYVTQEECDGLHVFPIGQFYSNNSPQGAYYRIATNLIGVNIDYRFHSSETDPVNKTGKSFVMSGTGRYIFEISYSDGGCPVDSIIIDYEQKDFDIEYSAVYICSSGGEPHFYLRAKNGMLPYTFELFENGVLVASNTTGNFIYGHPDNTYSVKVTDACGTNSSVDLQIFDFLTDAIISGTDKACLGGTLSLSCLSLGASSFQWTGPAGFSSNEQNVFIENITPDNLGTYSVSIQPYGCFVPITQSFDVSIYNTPSVPSAPDILMFCENGDNTLPVIETLPEHSLVWYAGDGITECLAPNLNTSTAHIEIYYIAQKYDVLGCVGDKHKITFIVNPLPSSEIDASIPKVCSGASPLVEIQNSIQDYIYDVYADMEKNNRLATMTGMKDNLISETLPVTIAQDTTYYITVTDINGCVSQLPMAVNASVVELYILPEYLPPYRIGVEYEYNLTTNAEAPDFGVSAGQLPTGLTLYPSGLLSGIPSENNDVYAMFTAKVEDVNRCTASRDYKFERITFIPQVFTPDNDGINDIFMPNSQVIIYDRFGIVVYEGSDGWDGTYKGKNLLSDIYFYKLFYKENNITKMKTGYIGLIRK